MIIDFPDTFAKFVPSLVRSGKWSAAKTLMTEAMRNGDELAKLGTPVNGLRGTAASAAGGPGREGVRRVLEVAASRERSRTRASRAPRSTRPTSRSSRR